MTIHQSRSDLRSVGEEEATARLLRLVRVGPDATPERAARVRAAVHTEWTSTVRRRRFRRRGGAAAVALGVAAVLLVIIRSGSSPESTSVPVVVSVATSERVDGAPSIARPAAGGTANERVSPGSVVRSGDLIETDSRSRLALRATDGSSVRVDRDSRARWISASVIELLDGTVYFATADGARSFEVRT